LCILSLWSKIVSKNIWSEINYLGYENMPRLWKYVQYVGAKSAQKANALAKITFNFPSFDELPESSQEIQIFNV